MVISRLGARQKLCANNAVCACPAAACAGQDAYRHGKRRRMAQQHARGFLRADRRKEDDGEVDHHRRGSIGTGIHPEDDTVCQPWWL